MPDSVADAVPAWDTVSNSLEFSATVNRPPKPAGALDAKAADAVLSGPPTDRGRGPIGTGYLRRC
jgi:hypothetical protein